MKKFFPVLFVTCIIYVSCKKEPVTEQPPPKINAAFYLTKTCNTLVLNDTMQYIDSTVLFINQSDTGQFVTYKWEFGDNTFSSQKNPTHIYNKPGVYPVILYTLYKNQPSDTFYRNVRIIIGQKEFKTSDAYNSALDLDESADKGTLVLISHYTPVSIGSYSLFSVDSMLKQKWIRPIAGGAATTRLSSLKRINANEYILSGNYQPGNTNQFALSKINASGDLIWEKYISNVSGINNFTLPASDGSLITIGNNTGNLYTIVVKCDATGNEIWRKLFNGVQSPLQIRFANNIIEIQGGYVFASVATNTGHIVLTKLDLNGNIVTQTSTASGNIGTITGTGVAFANNNYMVYAGNTTSVFMFNSALSFIEARMVAQGSINSATAGNGHFYLAEGRFQYASVRQLNSDGMQVWGSTINHGIVLSCNSYATGATRYCKKVLYTSYNEIVALSDGQNNAGGGFNSSSIYMEKFLPNGNIK